MWGSRQADLIAAGRPIDCFVIRVRAPTREFLREIVAACVFGVSTETNPCRADMSVLGGGCIITLQMPQRLQERNTWTS